MDALSSNQPARSPFSPAPLEGTEWRLADYLGREGALVRVPEDVIATAQLAGGTVSGATGCNRYHAPCRGGVAATVGGALWLAGFVWSSLDPADSDPGGTVALLGSIALLIGLAGLSAFQARTHPTLVWAAFLLPAVGGAVMTFGLVMMAVYPDKPIVGDVSGWYFFIVGLLATMAGSILFAIATWRTGALPRSGAILLGIASAISLVSFFGSSALGEWLQALFIAGFLAFPIGWMVLGLQAIRLDRPVMATGAA